MFAFANSLPPTLFLPDSVGGSGGVGIGVGGGRGGGIGGGSRVGAGTVGTQVSRLSPLPVVALAAAAFLAAATAAFPLFFPPAFFALAAASRAFIATAGSTSAGSADSPPAAGSASSLATSTFAAASSFAAASGFFFPFFFFFCHGGCCVRIVMAGCVIVQVLGVCVAAGRHTFFFDEASASASAASVGAQVAAPSASGCSHSGLAGELTSAATFSLSISGLLGLSMGTLGLSLAVNVAILSRAKV